MDSSAILVVSETQETEPRLPIAVPECPPPPHTVVLSTVERDEVLALEAEGVRAIINRQKINDVRYLNKFFKAVNEKLDLGGWFVGSAETSEQRKARLLARHPGWYGRAYYAGDFIFKRVFPKLPITRRVYFAVTKGRNRVLSRAEVLGRLCSCGFEIRRTEDVEGRLHFAVRKVRAPSNESNPSYGPLFRMGRVGQHGRRIYVYKLRTMHPYAEYLQEYVYQLGKQQPSGKFNADFRITTWGRYLRRIWLDELPMLINWFRGELKLVGVRPVSEHYLSLYPPALAERRSRHRPGLVPPYYADLPHGFEEVLRSEEKYLDNYELQPMRTDALYLLRALYNILFRNARSQ